MEFVYYFLIILFVLLQAYFAGIETSFISASKIKIKSMITKQKKYRIIISLIKSPERVISALLVGTNICTVGAASVATMLFVRKYGEIGEYYSTIFITLIILIFSEILPKSIFRKLAEPMIIWTFPILDFSTKLFSPVATLIVKFVKNLPFVSKLKNKYKKSFITREDLKTLFHLTAKKGKFKEFEAKILNRVFDFGSTYAREIMVPLIDMYILSIDKKIKDVIELSQKTSFTKIPIYQNQAYNIIGYVDLYKIYKAKLTEGLKKYIIKAFYVPETKRIDDLFIEMNSKNIPMAFVVDEFGSVSGLVTREDIVEKVIGEIENRETFSEEEEEIKKSKTNEWIVQGDIDVDDLFDETEIKLPKYGYETLAGFIEYKLGRIPKSGEYFEYEDYIIKILKSDSRVIKKVLIKKKE